MHLELGYRMYGIYGIYKMMPTEPRAGKNMRELTSWLLTATYVT
jgi:hypothetical protein